MLPSRSEECFHCSMEGIDQAGKCISCYQQGEIAAQGCAKVCQLRYAAMRQQCLLIHVKKKPALFLIVLLFQAYSHAYTCVRHTTCTLYAYECTFEKRKKKTTRTLCFDTWLLKSLFFPTSYSLTMGRLRFP